MHIADSLNFDRPRIFSLLYRLSNLYICFLCFRGAMMNTPYLYLGPNDPISQVNVVVFPKRERSIRMPYTRHHRSHAGFSVLSPSPLSSSTHPCISHVRLIFTRGIHLPLIGAFCVLIVVCTFDIRIGVRQLSELGSRYLHKLP